MANLSRWVLQTPKWLGNDKQEDPFQVKVKRLLRSELDAFRDRVAEWQRNPTGVAEAVSIFDGVLEAPIGTLTIDGEPISDLRRLMEIACQEISAFDGLLFELIQIISAVQRPSETESGES